MWSTGRELEENGEVDNRKVEKIFLKKGKKLATKYNYVHNSASAQTQLQLIFLRPLFIVFSRCNTIGLKRGRAERTGYEGRWRVKDT